VKKLRMMRWVAYVAWMGEISIAKKFQLQNLKGRDYLGDPDIDERIISKRILKK
jgi:hypothetical protein